MEVQIIALPAEVNELAVKVSASKQEEVQTILQQIFTGTDTWERQVDEIVIKDVKDKFSIQLADAARKNAKQARLNAEKIFDAKRLEVQNLKASFDIEDKLWLKAKQVMQIKFKAIEEKAEWKANFVKRFDAEQKEAIVQNRILAVSKFAEINRIEFEYMSAESFASFYHGLESTYNSKIEAERIAAEEKAAAEKAAAIYWEKQRLENERLKAEAEAMEKEMAEERKKAAAILELELKVAAANAKIEREKEAAETKKQYEAKLAAERKIAMAQAAEAAAEARQYEAKLAAAKQYAEEQEKARAAAKKLQDEKDAIARAEAKAAEKLAKAPIKKQLSIWVDGFSIAETAIDNEKAVLIADKFKLFKAWAKKEIESI